MSEKEPRKRSSSGKKRSRQRAPAPWEKFLHLVETLCTDLGLTIRSLTGTCLTTVDADGREMTTYLDNLLRLAASRDEADWPQLITEYLSVLQPAAVDRRLEALEHGLAANEDNLLPVLKPFSFAQSSNMWFQPLIQDDPAYQLVSLLLEEMPPAADPSHPKHALQDNPCDPCLLLAIDFPESMCYVTQDMVKQAGRPATEWTERAFYNLEQKTPENWFEVLDEDGDIKWVTVHDCYDASRALILDRLLPQASPRGWFVAPVGRDRLYFMPANDYNAARSVVPVYRAAAEEYTQAPYPISDQLYWVYEGRWYRFPIVLQEDASLVTPPLEFCRVFGMLSEQTTEAAEEETDQAP
jgi:hypothetical protein